MMFSSLYQTEKKKSSNHHQLILLSLTFNWSKTH